MLRSLKCFLFVTCVGSWLVDGSAAAQQPSKHVLADIASGAIQRPTITVYPAGSTQPVMRNIPFMSGGRLHTAAAAARTQALRSTQPLAAEAAAPGASLGETQNTVGCSNRTSNGNVRVNQDCTYRGQAEERIAYNPANPNNLLAGQNDHRVGFNQCAIDWSVDDGAHWGDMVPPFRTRINDPESETPTPTDPNSHTIAGGPGTGHTYDADSDPAPAFDSRGRGFFTCIAFDINSNANLIYATQSPLGAQGSYFFNVQQDRFFIIDEENNAAASLDKPFIIADTFKHSPNRDTVYATYTVFNFTCGPSGNFFCSNDIYASMSTDHGLTWSTPQNISGSSTTLCFFGNFFDPTRSPNACDLDQGSDPAPQPNGDLVVVFNNGNTPAGNPNGQQLAVICHPSGSSPAGTANLNCGSPVKVGDDITVGEPQCAGLGECIPGAFVRTDDFPRIGFNPGNGDLFATWQDYRNGEFDIQLARSTDGGHTWQPSVTVNPDSGTDHYEAAVAVAHSEEGDRVGVSYYRSQRVPNENVTPATGFAPGQPGVQQGTSDYVLAGGSGLKAPYRFTVLTPEFPAPDADQAGFNGDYSGLIINKGDEAHPIWSDTRNTNPTPFDGAAIHDEDIFTMTLDLP